MSAPTKTLAMRLLEAHGVPYEAVYFDVARHLTAAEVAAVVGLPPEQTFKTLVALPDRPRAKPILALVPGDSQLDLKRLAAAAGEKKITMAAQRDAERLTGLQKGGISPLALQDKHWPVYIDETVVLFERVWISAGRVGCGVIAEVDGLLRVLDARLAPIATPG